MTEPKARAREATEATDLSTIPDTGLATTDSSGDYEQVIVYLHKPTGYYYNPTSQQYLVPVSHSYCEQQSVTTTSAAHSVTRIAPLATKCDEADVDSLTTGHTDSKSKLPFIAGLQGDSDEEELQKLSALEKEFKTSKEQSISSMLSEVSERVMERCGYQIEESPRTSFQDKLFYDQDLQLYFDPSRDCYYQYDHEQRRYVFHSQVTPIDAKGQDTARKEKKKCIVISSDSDSVSEEEEGEIRSPKRPRLPIGSPPPENQWISCLRMVVTDSDSLGKGSVFIITAKGANIGREPEGVNGVKIPELCVSKSHAKLSYDKAEQCFTLTDLGSVNGSSLNNHRLSKPKEACTPHPISHGDTLTIGSTTCSMHIHAGLEVCDGCDPGNPLPPVEAAKIETKESLDLKRRKELNRIKKKYGLRVKDVFGERPEEKGHYKDRAELRRVTVGSDLPDLDYPDALPSSADRAIDDDNVGHRMLVKMGWSGTGLGKEEQGHVNPASLKQRQYGFFPNPILAPVRTQIRNPKSGLGFEDSGRSGLDSRNSKSKRMRKRFDEISN